MYLRINMKTLLIKNTYFEYTLYMHIPHVYHVHTMHKVCTFNTYHVFSKNLYRLNAENKHVNC